MNQSKRKKVIIIGAGISGLSAACYAAKAGHKVHILEKNGSPGGRARQFKTEEGFTFDMGPSWYWMPDIIENFFQDFGFRSADFYTLDPLNPQFEFISKDKRVSIPKDAKEIRALFESEEPGAGKKYDDFMRAAKFKYEVGMQQFIDKPCHSILEFTKPSLLSSALKLHLFRNFRSYVGSYFKSPLLRSIMEFPVIFLGASPAKIPAMYSLMNYGGYELGTWYPQGGFFELIKAMVKIAEDLGVKIHYHAAVKDLKLIADQSKNMRIASFKIQNETHTADEIIASCDYQHMESLLPEKFRNYSSSYWEKKTFAPSSLIVYLGIKGKIPSMKHHTLFFDAGLDEHLDEIYKEKSWPKNPLFYVCCPSKTDPHVAPSGAENLFLLMPLATGLEDTEEAREKYLDIMLFRIQKHFDCPDIKERILYKRSYCVADFKKDYHAYGGNAYGLANTLSQTAILKPSIRNKKIKNLHYTGQLTVPGPGVPPSLISGKIVSNEI